MLCAFSDCNGGPMHYHGHYKRSVILSDFVSEPFGVHRYRCRTCKRTLSFLPDFCVPYKHFGTDIIFWVLQLLLLVGYSAGELARPFGSLNDFGVSRWCINVWLNQFEHNSHNLWHFGLPRLLGCMVDREDLAKLFSYFVDPSTNDPKELTYPARLAQAGLSKKFPPFGFFRAQLLPGCVT